MAASIAGKISSPAQSQLQVEAASAMVDVLSCFIVADFQPDNQPAEKIGDISHQFARKTFNPWAGFVES
jgi:hypothetical protein